MSARIKIMLVAVISLISITAWSFAAEVQGSSASSGNVAIGTTTNTDVKAPKTTKVKKEKKAKVKKTKKVVEKK
jgi:hypothetical protein